MPNPKIAQAGSRTRFAKGMSGNPGGRPSLKPLTDELRRMIEETDPKTRKRLARRIAEIVVKKALAGSARHIELLMDRIEGRPRQALHVTGELPEPRYKTREEILARIAEILNREERKQVGFD